MPYIKQDNRLKFDEGIADLLGALQTEDTVKMGELNYVFSAIIWSLFENYPSYSTANGLIGVLELVKSEFIRRKVNLFEDKKITENGDII